MSDNDKARTRRARAQVRKLNLADTPKDEVAPEVALANYDDTFLECRDLGHPWRVVGFFRFGGEIRRSLQCPRCTTHSTDIWRPNGERVSRRYNYVAGYEMKGTSVSRFHVRRETLNRVTVYESEADMVAALFTKPATKKKAG